MTGIFTDAVCRRHDPGMGHPESPARYDAVLAGLAQLGKQTGWVAMAHRSPVEQSEAHQEGREAATRDDLLLVHTAAYLELAKAEIEAGESQLSTGDTSVCRGTWDAALGAVGCALAAVDAVLGGKAGNAFCVVRPPGHHASTNRGMGFCVLNNIALAARHAQRRHGIERVLIVDWDVHHGNGTQDVFYNDGSVFFFSTHQWPLYPETGRASETGSGAGVGTTLNCPLPAGSGRAEIFEAFEKKLIPAADVFRPNLVLISAGFDSRVGDPLGDFALTDSDFADLTRLVMQIAKKHCGGRIVSVLEGGYNLKGLASAAAAHVEALRGKV